MKKITSTLLSAALAALMLTGCTARNEVTNGSKVTASPDVEQTQSVEPTSESTVEPTALPTETPASAERVCIELAPNEPLNIDIDFDGSEDTILFTEEKIDDWEANYKLIVTRGAEESTLFEHEISHGKAASLIIIDCDENDSRLDILLSWDRCSDDPESLICRVNEDGSGMFIQSGECYFDISDTSLNQGEFEISVKANLLSADFLSAVATVDASGMKLVDDFKFLTSDDSYWLEVQSLKREMTVRIVNDDNSLGDEVIVPVGEHVVPVSTDLESYVKFRIPDGRIGQVKLSALYLNDVFQDDYFTEKLNYEG